VTGAARVELGPKGGVLSAVDSVGSREFPISIRTVFQLIAYDEKGRTVSREIEVKFKKAAPPVEPLGGDPANPDGGAPDPASTPPPLLVGVSGN
jgi:hypothetical protein